MGRAFFVVGGSSTATEVPRKLFGRIGQQCLGVVRACGLSVSDEHRPCCDAPRILRVVRDHKGEAIAERFPGKVQHLCLQGRAERGEGFVQ